MSLRQYVSCISGVQWFLYLRCTRSLYNVLISSSDADSSNIYIYKAREDSPPLHILDKIHHRPVHVMTYNPVYNCVVSIDTGGTIEYWEPSGEFSKPLSLFQFKSTTDLYDFKKVFTTNKSINFRQNLFHRH